MYDLVLLCLLLVIVFYKEYKENQNMIIVQQCDEFNKLCKKFKVRDTASKCKIAKVLYKMHKKTQRLCDLLSKSEFKDEPNVKRLLKNRNVPLQEKSYYQDQEVAYSINKGELIALCVKHKDKMEDEQAMYFVLCHELAHIMTKEYGHTQNFWNNMRFLLEFSYQHGLYKYKDYRKNPVNYCGMTINHMP